MTVAEDGDRQRWELLLAVLSGVHSSSQCTEQYSYLCWLANTTL